jgi:hypothetical protein
MVKLDSSKEPTFQAINLYVRYDDKGTSYNIILIKLSKKKEG